MAVPSNEEFIKSINLFFEYDALELAEHFWDLSSISGSTSEMLAKIYSKMSEQGYSREIIFKKRLDDLLTYGKFNLKPTYQNAKDFVITEDELLQQKWNSITKSPAVVWLLNQPSTSRALKSAFGKSSLSDEEITHRKVNFLLRPSINSRQEKSLDGLEQKDFEGRLVRSIRRKRGTFFADLLGSLRIYFYQDINGYNESYRQEKMVCIELKNNISSLLDLIKAQQSFEIHNNAYNKLERLLERTNFEIEDLIEAADSKFRPLERGGQTAKERLLVFNLWMTFQKEFKYRGVQSSKSTAINHFLSLEGIANPIEQRAIEKAIQGWRGKLKELRESETTNLETRLRRQEQRKLLRVYM